MPFQVQAGSQVKRGDGAYRLAAVSGVLTGVAAATTSAGHIFAMRWAPADSKNGPQKVRIGRLRARLTTITGPTTGQEIGMDASIVRAYTAAHTGGTAMDMTAASGNTNKKRTAFAPSVFGAANIEIGNTGALTNGTETFDAQPFASASIHELNSGAAVPTGVVELYLSTDDLTEQPIELAPNEGIVIRNTVAQGTGYTGRLVVEVDWLELLRL